MDTLAITLLPCAAKDFEVFLAAIAASRVGARLQAC